jgi:hypothetical protein
MKLTTLGLIIPAAVAAAIALPATARADNRPFLSPSGNIACLVGSDNASCDIADYTYQLPPPPPCAQHIKFGNRFSLEPGKKAEMVCHGDTVRIAGEPTLNFGQTVSAGTITCESQPAGVKCTDSSSGHYFRVSRESYELG